MSDLAQAMQNIGVEIAQEITASESELLMAVNCVALNILEQGLGTQEKLKVAPLLAAQWREFIREYKRGLIKLEYQIQADSEKALQ